MQEEKDIICNYPDLSDDDEQPIQQNVHKQEEEICSQSLPSKKIKTDKEQEPMQKGIIAPKIFGGKQFRPPPPPPSSKPKNMAPISEMKGESYKNNYHNNSYENSCHSNSYQGTSHNNSLNNSVSKNQNRNIGNDYNNYNYNREKERERKSCIYVKNIPKHFNQVDKLMTFFRNEGAIREIKPNQEDYSAIVRFHKEEHAHKFVTSGKAIFNRTYIVYSLTDKDQVSPQLIKERENDENTKNKRNPEVQLKQMKERLDTIMADKYRALLFLRKNATSESEKEAYNQEMRECEVSKEHLIKMHEDQCRRTILTAINQYDWTLAFQITAHNPIDKNQLKAEYQKYGPVEHLQLNLLHQNIELLPEQQLAQKTHIQQQPLPNIQQHPLPNIQQSGQAKEPIIEGQEPIIEGQELIIEGQELKEPKISGQNQGVEKQSKVFQYIVKLMFLGVRSSWDFYCEKSQIIPQSEALKNRDEERYVIEAEGSKMNALYCEGKLKINKKVSQHLDQKVVEEVLEKNEEHEKLISQGKQEEKRQKNTLEIYSSNAVVQESHAFMIDEVQPKSEQQTRKQ